MYSWQGSNSVLLLETKPPTLFAVFSVQGLSGCIILFIQMSVKSNIQSLIFSHSGFLRFLIKTDNWTVSRKWHLSFRLTFIKGFCGNIMNLKFYSWQSWSNAFLLLKVACLRDIFFVLLYSVLPCSRSHATVPFFVPVWCLSDSCEPFQLTSKAENWYMFKQHMSIPVQIVMWVTAIITRTKDSQTFPAKLDFC